MRNTNMIKQTFEYFLDLSTSDQNATIVKIKAGGAYVKSRLLPFFTAFKYYKLGSVRMKMVPASTLPVDPTGLSYEAGENTVDPRDMMNPGLIRITNGEDMCPDRATISEAAYNALVCDHRWFKFRLNQGCQRTAKPLVWDVGQLHQDIAPGAIKNIPSIDGDLDGYVASSHDNAVYNPMDGAGDGAGDGADSPLSGWENNPYLMIRNSDPRGLFQTGLKEKLGWLPTDFSQQFEFVRDNGSYIVGKKYGINAVPEVELISMILPQAHKTKFYYRLYISETVYFKDPVANFVNIDYLQSTAMNTIDRALVPAMLKQEMTGGDVHHGYEFSPVPNEGQGNY